MSPVTIRGLQRQYTVHTYGTKLVFFFSFLFSPSHVHYLYVPLGRDTADRYGEIGRNQEIQPTYQKRTGACRKSEDVTAVLQWGYPGPPFARCQGCPIHSCWCELRPRPVIFCMFPITEPCRPCAQFCGVRGHMSMIYLGVNLLQVGSRTSAEAQ